MMRDEPVAPLKEDLFNERVQVFVEFLDSQRSGDDGSEYKAKIKSMLLRGDTRLIVNINDVRAFNVDYSQGLLIDSANYLDAFDRALKLMVDSFNYMDFPFIDMARVFFRIGLDGAFGEHHTDPRTLSTRFISKLVCLDGIATSCFQIHPKLVKSVHYVEKRNIFITREYRDATMSSNYIPTSNAYPTEDSEGNPLSTEYGYCIYRDCQRISIQEMPEKAPPGQLPRSVEILLQDDLVDRVKPGDRIRAVGIYKSLAHVHNDQAPNSFRTVVLANNVKVLGLESSQLVLSDLDIRHIKQISKRSDVFRMLAASMAPFICGHEYVKQAVLLMLLGGTEKNLENTHIRGDINILMVGDPSTAKSQILRFILNTAPLAIATTGRGSSGVGLTAAVTTDKETGERKLEAGAMVLADRGVVCIDEFDKMSVLDRVAIHEVMEQQTVTIAKAGIHLSLNARCSVVAAANPVWSQYRESVSPQENIRLPDSLLSRFDLLFIVLDRMDEEIDKQVSTHVTTMHRLANSTMAGERDEESIFRRLDESGDEYLSVEFVKKYIHYAKLRIRPVLTGKASESIKKIYNKLRKDRNEESTKILPITPRTLETLIRLSTAHAKARLSHTVDSQDTLVAEDLLEHCLHREQSAASKRARAVDSNEQPHRDPQSVRDRIKDALSKLQLTKPGESFFSVNVLEKELDSEQTHVSMHEIEIALRQMEADNLLMYRDGMIILV